MVQKFALNKLVNRQVADSKHSHFNGTWDELVQLVEANFQNATPGYRDGVLLIPVPADKFFSGVIEIKEDTPLKAEFLARRKGEEPYVSVVVVDGEKLPAEAVEIVVYRHDVLEDDATTDAEWEIISINARPTKGPEPMNPIAMARNFLELTGGTKAEYTAQQFAEAIMYWSKRAMKG